MMSERIKFAIICIIVLHFSIIATVMMAQILEHKSKPVSMLSKYMIAPFDQDWRMFAPPANSNFTIFLRFTSYQGDTYSESEWLDVIGPLNEAKRKKPFLSVGTTYISYLLSNSISHIVEAKIAYMELASKIDTTKFDGLRKKKSLDKKSEKLNYGDYIVLNYSKTVYEKLASQTAETDSVHVEWKIVDYTYPRFSKRTYDYFDQNNMEILTLLRPKHNLYTHQRIL